MALAMTNFWSAFFILLIWVPLVCLWIAALVDVMRRPDLGGGSKVLWVIVILCVPWLGVLIYLIARPSVVVDTA
jgi:Phospholipase_D-nuclease N-terminal